MEVTSAPPRADAVPRLESLDALRGLAVAGMILVNQPGDPNQVLGWLGHSGWHGLSPADVVFPLFVLVVGASVAISMRRYRHAAPDAGDGSGDGRTPRPWRKVVVRAARLVALGYALNVVLALPYFDPFHTRIPGVLQRIGLCYLGCAAVVLVAGERAQLGVAVALLAGYGLALRFVRVPGIGAGVLDDPASTLPAYVDRWLFGDRLWQGSWDPEGLLSTVPAIASALLGSVAGAALVTARDTEARVRVLKLGAAASLGSGMLVVAAQPINKNLWTPAFALVCAGLSLVLWAACVVIVEEKGGARWLRPLVALGANPLLAYVGSEVVGQVLTIVPSTERSMRGWVTANVFGALGSPALASLGYGLVTLAAWTAIAAALHRRGVFWKL